MIESILKSFEVWSDAQGVKSKGRVKSIDNISLEGISKLKDLILDLAIRGKLVSQNNDDEPASELLKRIQKEKEKLIEEGKLKNSAALHKVADEEKLFALPESWIWSRVGEIGIGMTGKTPSTSIDKYFGGKIPFVGPGQITNRGTITNSDKTLTDEGAENSTIADSGDILMVCIGGSIGKSAIVKSRITFNQQLNGIRPILIDTIYLFNAFSSSYFQNTVLKKSTGSATPIINRGKWEEISIPVPPLNEQKRIVEKIDELMAFCNKLEEEKINNLKTHQNLVGCLLETLTIDSDVDALQASWERISKQFDTLFCTDDSIDRLKETILYLAISGKLVKQNANDEPASILLSNIKNKKEELFQNGEIKKDKSLPVISDYEKPFNLLNGWRWCRLEELCFIITKGSSPKWQGVSYTENPEDVLFVTSENVGSYELLLDTEKFVELKFNEIEPKSILQNGDFLMNIVGGSIGRTAIFNLDRIANINQAVCLIRTIKGFMNSQFLLHFFNSSICISYMFDKQVDNARANLSMGNIAKFVIPIPPQSEQQRIVEKISELYSLCDLLKERIASSQTIKVHLSETVIEL